METHQQPSSGPDEPTRALTRRLANLAKNDGPRFAAVVRRADVAHAAGTPRDEAYRLALDEASAGHAGEERGDAV